MGRSPHLDTAPGGGHPTKLRQSDRQQGQCARAHRVIRLTRRHRPDRVGAYIDGMDRALETAYEASPWRLFVVDAATSKVAFRTGPGPLNGIAKARALRDFLAANREF